MDSSKVKLTSRGELLFRKRKLVSFYFSFNLCNHHLIFEYYVEFFCYRVYENRNVYEGDFLNAWRHGFGKYVTASGSTYEGNFAYDEYEGEGFLQYPPDHDKYIQYKGEF